jgi:hypothetical protein
MDPVGILRQTYLFADLAEEDVAALLPEIGERTFARGESVWIEGDPALALYVVADGQLKAHRVGVDGGEVILGINQAVDLFGEVGLFHPGGVRLVSMTAMTPSRCLRLAKAPLVAFLAGHPVAMERSAGMAAPIPSARGRQLPPCPSRLSQSWSSATPRSIVAIRPNRRRGGACRRACASRRPQPISPCTWWRPARTGRRPTSSVPRWWRAPARCH